MQRSPFLALAVVGYAISAVLAYSDAGTATVIALAVSTVPLLVWVIALGVTTGILDADGERGEVERGRQASDFLRRPENPVTGTAGEAERP